MASFGDYAGDGGMGGFGGASNFSGGGFMNSPGMGDSPSGDKKRSGAQHQTLRPVTIRQILQAEQPNPDESFVVDGRDLEHVTVVAMIKDVNEQNTAVNLLLNDGTGAIDARLWIDAADETVPVQREDWVQGIYVRVFGHIRSFGDRRTLVIFSLRRINDFNEITYHMTECLYHVLKPAGAGQPKVEGGAPMFGGGSGGGFGGGAGLISGAASHFSHPQQQIMNVIQQNHSEHGASLDDVCMALQGVLARDQIRSEIENLQGEGHLYTTIDDDHFRTTS